MDRALPRPLLLRLADELRARLPRDASTGLPSLAALEVADEEALCEAGGGRLAAVALVVGPCAVAASPLADQIRRNDVLLCGSADSLVVVAAGLRPDEVGQLAQRLVGVLAAAGLRATVGVAQRGRMYGARASVAAGESVARAARERAGAAAHAA